MEGVLPGRTWPHKVDRALLTIRVSPLYFGNESSDSSQLTLARVTEGGMKMSDPEFVCSACDTGHESHEGDVMTECRVCNRIHCSECVDEYGRCIECSKD